MKALLLHLVRYFRSPYTAATVALFLLYALLIQYCARAGLDEVQGGRLAMGAYPGVHGELASLDGATVKWAAVAAGTLPVPIEYAFPPTARPEERPVASYRCTAVVSFQFVPLGADVVARRGGGGGDVRAPFWAAYPRADYTLLVPSATLSDGSAAVPLAGQVAAMAEVLAGPESAVVPFAAAAEGGSSSSMLVDGTAGGATGVSLVRLSTSALHLLLVAAEPVHTGAVISGHSVFAFLEFPQSPNCVPGAPDACKAAVLAALALALANTTTTTAVGVVAAVVRRIAEHHRADWVVLGSFCGPAAPTPSDAASTTILSWEATEVDAAPASGPTRRPLLWVCLPLPFFASTAVVEFYPVLGIVAAVS